MKLVIKINFNAKITEMKNEILSISGLATSYALKAFENKIPNVSSLDKKKNKKKQNKQIVIQKLLK